MKNYRGAVAARGDLPDHYPSGYLCPREEQPMEAASCPVCLNESTRFYAGAGARGYLCCEVCAAVFLHPSQLPDAGAERERYRHHENAPEDEGYRRFLMRLAEPLLARLPARAQGLDYGCGPSPVLAGILRAAGHEVSLYDPFFYPDAAPLARGYDFVTCSEVVEHFHRPAAEFDRLGRLLKPGGLLAVMTCFIGDAADFANWHYRNDLTHVVFYTPETFELIAARRGWSCEVPCKDIVFMRKRGA